MEDMVDAYMRKPHWIPCIEREWMKDKSAKEKDRFDEVTAYEIFGSGETGPIPKLRRLLEVGRSEVERINQKMGCLQQNLESTILNQHLLYSFQDGDNGRELNSGVDALSKELFKKETHLKDMKSIKALISKTKDHPFYLRNKGFKPE
mmetsp:Transcript_43812/g.85728  ORF Transcript_43812/g.85728 Transcript_43812/m.85728 type:complete len:148 (-) Transcript_43812:74-517(-)